MILFCSHCWWHCLVVLWFVFCRLSSRCSCNIVCTCCNTLIFSTPYFSCISFLVGRMCSAFCTCWFSRLVLNYHWCFHGTRRN
jgi:hypothetical protein